MATPTTRRATLRSPDLIARDAAIARGLARQEPAALEHLYAVTSRACFSVIHGYVRDRGHAEDVQQQVYAELWRRSAEFDAGRGSLLTWVLTVARSRALDHLRRRSEQPAPADELMALGEAEHDRAFDDVLERAMIAEGLAALPHNERDLLRMRFWDGLSQTEISDRTGIPLGTVKSRMTAGLGRLRLFLADHEVDR